MISVPALWSEKIKYYFIGHPRYNAHLCVPALPEDVRALVKILGKDLRIEWCDQGNSWIVTVTDGRLRMIRTVGARCPPHVWRRLIGRMYDATHSRFI